MGAAASARMGCSLYIIKVSPGSPAQAAGLLPFFHYIIGINGEPVVSEEDIQRISTSWAAGALQVLVLDSRNGGSRNVSLKRQAEEKIGFSVKLHRGPMNLVSFRVLDLDYNSPCLEARLQKDQDFIIAHEHGPFSNMNEFESIMYRHRGSPVILWVYNIGTCEVRQVSITPNEDGKIGCSLGAGIKNELPYLDGGVDLVQASDNILQPLPAQPSQHKAEIVPESATETPIPAQSPNPAVPGGVEGSVSPAGPAGDTLASLPGAVIESGSCREAAEAPGESESVFETGTSAPPGQLVLPQSQLNPGAPSEVSGPVSAPYGSSTEHMSNSGILGHNTQDTTNSGIFQYTEHRNDAGTIEGGGEHLGSRDNLKQDRDVSCGRPSDYPSVHNPNFFLSDNPDEEAVVEQKETWTPDLASAVTAESEEEDTSALFRDHYVPFLLDVEGRPGESRKQEEARSSFQTDYVGHKDRLPK